MTKEYLEHHIEMLQYFYEDKGDMERYCSFEKVWAELQIKMPHLVKAYEDMKSSIKTFEILLKHAVEELED